MGFVKESVQSILDAVVKEQLEYYRWIKYYSDVVVSEPGSDQCL